MTEQSTSAGQGSGAAPKPELTASGSACPEGDNGAAGNESVSSPIDQVRRLLQNLRLHDLLGTL